MGKFNFLEKLWHNRKTRNILILVFLVIILIITAKINFESSEPRKSERVLMCGKCGYAGIFKFTELKQLKCPKCKTGRMKYCMKCAACEYEFPYVETPLIEEQGKKISAIRAQRIMDRRCPNCGDHEVFPISNVIWRKKHPK